MKHGKNRIRVPSDRLHLKVVDDESGIKIYLPSDPGELRRCRRSQLPSHLLDILEIPENAGKSLFRADAGRRLYRLLTEDPHDLAKILNEEDIPQIDWLDRGESIFDESVELDYDLTTVGADDETNSYGTPSFLHRNNIYNTTNMDIIVQLNSTGTRAGIIANEEISSAPQPAYDGYPRLLRRVMQEARRIGSSFNDSQSQRAETPASSSSLFGNSSQGSRATVFSFEGRGHTSSSGSRSFSSLGSGGNVFGSRGEWSASGSQSPVDSTNTNAFDVTAISEALLDGEDPRNSNDAAVFGVRRDNPLAYGERVGACGQLFVSVLLRPSVNREMDESGLNNNF